MLHPKGKFLGHERCPKCAANGHDNSGDNLARYEFNVFCLACGYHALTDSSFKSFTKVDKMELKPMKPLPTGQLTIPCDDGWESKKLSANILKQYGVEWVAEVSENGTPVLDHDEDGNPIQVDDGRLRFPYYSVTSGKLIGFKYRDMGHEEETGKKKVRSFNGDHFSVFGLNVKGSGKSLILTEGETDTMAWKQACPECTVWGIPGAQWIEKSLQAVLEKAVTHYERIYLALDNDDAGRDAVEVALSILPPVVTYTVTYIHKDAVDTLVEDGTKGLKELLKNAQQVNPADIMGDDELLEKALDFSENHDSLFGTTMGYDGLDRAVGGWAPGKVIMFGGDTGSGKTTFTLQVVHKAIHNGKRVFFIPLEMTPEQCVLKLLEMELERPIISDPNAEQPARDAKRKALQFILEHVKFLNKFGSLDKSYLEMQIEIAVRAFKCDVVVLDHITAAATANGGGWAEIDQMIYAIKGAALKHRISIWVISHINGIKEGERPNINMLRGSRALAQAVDAVLFIHRDHARGHSEVFTGKVDRFLGKIIVTHFEMRKQRFIEVQAESSFDDGIDEFNLDVEEPEFGEDKQKEAESYFGDRRYSVKERVRESNLRGKRRVGLRTRKT